MKATCTYGSPSVVWSSRWSWSACPRSPIPAPARAASCERKVRMRSISILTLCSMTVLTSYVALGAAAASTAVALDVDARPATVALEATARPAAVTPAHDNGADPRTSSLAGLDQVCSSPGDCFAITGPGAGNLGSAAFGITGPEPADFGAFFCSNTEWFIDWPASSEHHFSPARRCGGELNHDVGGPLVVSPDCHGPGTAGTIGGLLGTCISRGSTYSIYDYSLCATKDCN